MFEEDTMDVSIKAGWIERHTVEQRKPNEDERDQRIERGLLITYAITQVAAIALTYASI
jgi:hypothetical protein